MRAALLVGVLVAACHRHAEAPRALAAELDHATAGDVAGWKLDEAAWRRIVVPPYDGYHADYARAFDDLAPQLAAELARAGAIATRQHYAGDLALTVGQARARWALPVLANTEVATRGGHAIDAVFVRDGIRWGAIVGIDRIVDDNVGALDPTCRTTIDVASPSQRCREITWEVADAALRKDRVRFDHACTLAAAACAKSLP